MSNGTETSNSLRVKRRELTELSGKTSPGFTTMPSARKEEILKQASS
jgi:hypothetical protein